MLTLLRPCVYSDTPTANGLCGSNHSPRRGFDEQYLPRRGPRASTSAPAPSKLRGPHREPRSGSFEDHPAPLRPRSPLP